MKNTNCKNILFINYGGIGDEILFLPVIQAFKKLYPDSSATLCLEKRARGIKTISDDIDNTIEVDIKACGIKKYLNVLKLIFTIRHMKFDMVISSGKSPFVAIILFLTGIKTRIGYSSSTSFLLTQSIPLNENCYAGNMYFDLLKPFDGAVFKLPKILYDDKFELPDGVKEGEFTLIHPGVSLMSIRKNIFKCPKTKFWIDLIKKILDKNETVLLAGGPDDEETINRILEDDAISKNPKFHSMFGKTKNLYEIAGLIKKSKRMICCDSAPLHIGVSLNANIIAIFGPTNEVKLVPDKENIIVVVKKTNCRPCLWHKRLTNCETSACLDFDVDDVVKFVK